LLSFELSYFFSFLGYKPLVKYLEYDLPKIVEVFFNYPIFLFIYWLFYWLIIFLFIYLFIYLFISWLFNLLLLRLLLYFNVVYFILIVLACRVPNQKATNGWNRR
jgi:hypothetical protein